MSIKKINKKIQEYGQKQYFTGYNTGFEDGRLHGSDEDFTSGAEAEQERIQQVLDIHIQWALESGKGGEVVMLNRVKEILVPIVLMDHLED
jgi:hypothetical protein